MNRPDALLAAMTLEEKIGQLTMATADRVVTGPVLPGDTEAGIRSGQIGCMLNLWGAEPVRKIQRMAVEETRLKIPLLLGFDVVHGHRTIFPIPLAEAAAFDPVLWQRTARVAAAEAAEDGIALTFAPMLDVTRDPRWGRIAEGPGEDPWLASRFAEAKVRGFQGDDLKAAASVLSPAPNISLLMARRPAASTTLQSTCPSAACMKSTCRPFRPPWPPVAPRSCRVSTTSPAFR